MSNYEDNPKSIKYLYKHQDWIKNKKVVDFPAGNGVTSQIIKDLGGTAFAFDLFPEYFTVEDLSCENANIMEGIPLEKATTDVVVCQEGIEHFSDQLKAFKEFNRILKKNGLLLMTTPNYSNLRARLSYMLAESERFNELMPPNELDSVWMANHEINKEIYFGHIFLIGIQKLRVLAKLAGFKIKHIQFTRAKSTSVLLLPFFYPFIYLSNWIAYRRSLRKNKQFNTQIKKEIYKEIFKLGINPKILVDGHLFVVFEKESDDEEVAEQLHHMRSFEFGTT
jgi:SAM-dependent methyltransferase